MSNENISGTCIICNRPLNPDFKPDEKKISLDLTQFPFKIVLKNLFKNLNILSPLVIPIICMIYLFRKLLKKPFTTLVFLGKKSRLHMIDLYSIGSINKNTLMIAEKYLFQSGFSHLLDYEDKSRAQAIIERLYINRSFGAYATVLITKQTGKILHVAFVAITDRKKITEYVNEDGLGEEQDQHLLQKYFPGKKILELWQIFSKDLEAIQEERLCPELDFMLPIFYRTRIHSIELGIKRGVLLENDLLIDNVSIPICYNHPTALAVRKCHTCGIAICEVCCKEVNGSFYCTKCLLPETATKMLRAPWGYAGAAIRFCASLVDIIITASVFAVIYFLLQFCLNFINPHNLKLITFIAAQPFLIFFLLWHNFYRVARKGQTFGKSLFGLRVISTKGTAPGYATATIRFLTALISFIFIFPLVGYVIIPFHKKKMGFQDKLSGSLVVSKNPERKALFAWIFTAPSVLALVVVSVVVVSNLFNVNNYLESKIELPVKWEIAKNKFSDMLKITICKNENSCFIFDSTSITSLNIWKGDTIWRNASFHEPHNISTNSSLPLFVTEYGDTVESVIMRIGELDGSVIWKKKLPFHDSWSFYIDSTYVVAYTKKQLFVLNNNGEILWENKLYFSNDTDKYYSYSVQNINNCLLFRVDDDDSTVNVMSFNFQNGEKIDSIQDYYQNPIDIGNDYRCTINKDRHYEVRSNSSDSVLFRIEDTLDYIEYCSTDTGKDKSTVLFYGQSRAYTSDGTIAFKFPDSCFLNDTSKNFLILGRRKYDGRSQMYVMEILLADKFSGHVIKTISDSAYSSFSYVSENEHTLFLKANQNTFHKKTQTSFSLLAQILYPSGFSTTSSLLMVNKKDLTVEKIILGKNIQLIILSNETNELFIQCIDRCGAYSLQNEIGVK